jgi:hypothetical protein
MRDHVIRSPSPPTSFKWLVGGVKITGQDDHSLKPEQPLHQLIMITTRHLGRVAATDPGILLVRRVEVKKCARAIVAREDLSPVSLLYFYGAEPLMQMG